jgi:hypothetical protein
MIHLLRKVRRTLLSGGKFRGYIGYAIGEIILVVIGILIALQINNWNEQYKDRQLEQSYYCKFLEDVNQDHALVKKLLVEDSVRIKYSLELLHLLQTPHPERSRVIFLLRETISKIRFRFRPSLSAFDDLKSSGKLTILRNATIKNGLLNYYAQMEGYGDISDLVADASLALYFNPSKDFVEYGIQDIYYVRNELDSVLLNSDALAAHNFPSADLRKKLMSEAMFNLNNNARKKELYLTMLDEIEKIELLLQAACR